MVETITKLRCDTCPATLAVNVELDDAVGIHNYTNDNRFALAISIGRQHGWRRTRQDDRLIDTCPACLERNAA